MFKIKYTGIEKVSIVLVGLLVFICLYTFIKFHSFVSSSISYLPLDPQTVSLITNIFVDFVLLYTLVITFIKIRRYKKSNLTVPEKYIELTFDESVSILMYNLDKLYLRVKSYLESKLR